MQQNYAYANLCNTDLSNIVKLYRLTSLWLIDIVGSITNYVKNMNETLSLAEYWSSLYPRLARYLPPSLFQQLSEIPPDFDQADKKSLRRIGREFMKATRALDPLHRVLIQYMPRFMLDLDPTPGQPHGEMLQGSYLFADMTGFTALTELLSKQGAARGPEAMNQIMNQLFEAILDPLMASGGDLLIFAGDAVLAYFPKQEDNQDVLQATRAALRMQRAVAPFKQFETDYGQCSLTMSVGVDSGEAYAGIVGSTQRMELLVSGPGIHGATHAEESGSPGEVILGEKARPIAERDFRFDGARVLDDFGDELGDYEIVQPRRKAGGSVFLSMEPQEVLQGIDAALQRVERLAPFLPEDMLAQMVNTDRHRKLTSELRPVAVQFINVVGIEDVAVKYGPELATEIFQRYFVEIQDIIKKHEGVVSQIDAYSKGFFLLNTYGVPKTHEGTRLYAVSSALQMAKAVEQINQEFDIDIPIQQRGGITYGLIFSGEIGARYRRESFVGGPAVNRAARLMSKAEFGQVILDSDIWAKTQSAFVGEQLPAVQLKGIDGPVVIVNVRDIRRGTRLPPLERPLVGREKELETLVAGLDQLVSEQTTHSAWMVEGESGTGKTAMMSDLASQARQRSIRILNGRCQPHGKHITLFPWIDLLSGWLDIDEYDDPAQQRAQLNHKLQTLDLTESEGILADVLGLPAPDPQSTIVAKPPASKTGGSLLDTLSGKLEMQQTVKKETAIEGGLQSLLQSRLSEREKPKETLWTQLQERISGPRVIINLLEKLAQTEPTLLILEDIHWIDEESGSLLKQLVAHLPSTSLMLVLTGRQSYEAEGVTNLKLEPLSHEAVNQIAVRAFGGEVLQEDLAKWINGRAGGSPLYTIELCQALQKSDTVFVDRGDGTVRWTGVEPALPLSLRELLLARFDELTPDQQDVLRWGAIIGDMFDDEALAILGEKRLTPQEIQDALRGAIQASFIVKTEPKIYRSPQTYRFVHPLMQEAIYETMSFSQRQMWHTQLADWLEEQPDSPLEVLAHHYLRGDNLEKAISFGRRVAERSCELGIYAGAFDYYDQILGLPGLSNEVQIEITEALADVLALQKDFEAAKTMYSQAIDLGSTIAREKLVLLSGDLDVLGQTEFSSEFEPWARGAEAWLMAQNGDTKEALHHLDLSFKGAKGAVRSGLSQMKKTLKSGQTLPDYEVWLNQFTEQMV